MFYQAEAEAKQFWVIQDLFKKGRKVIGIYAFADEAGAQAMADDYAKRYPMHGYRVQLGLAGCRG